MERLNRSMKSWARSKQIRHKRLAQEFVSLATVKFVEEIVEVPRGRLFVTFQSKQLRNFVIVKFVHASAI